MKWEIHGTIGRPLDRMSMEPFRITGGTKKEVMDQLKLMKSNVARLGYRVLDNPQPKKVRE